MAERKTELYAFNRGVVSPLMLARADTGGTALSAEIQENFIPSPLGPMSLRPGLEHIGATRNNAVSKHIPFVYSATDKAIIELTDSAMRVRIDDELITRPTVTSAITNGTFDTDLTGWTDIDEGVTPVSQWLTGGYMSLQGDGTYAARRRQLVSALFPNAGVEHTLEINIARGPVTLRVGSSTTEDDYVEETQLATGYHSISFTPASSFYVTLMSREEYPCLVDSVAIASAGVMVLTTPWAAASLPKLRYSQSADVVWVTCEGVRTQRIERRSARAWSIVDYTSNYGPFRVENTTETALTASALTGQITLTSSSSLFRSAHVGALFSLTSNGQTVSQTAAGQDVFTDPILVTGTEAARIFALTIEGVWTATVTLQRSVGQVGDWQDVVSYTTNQSLSFDDGLDNQIIYYRLGIKLGAYIIGSADLTLAYAGGSITGIVRVTAFSSDSAVTGVVLRDLGSTDATKRWREGAWSAYRGYPSAVSIFDARLWFVGLDKFWGSVVDQYDNHDDTTVGDSGPISRSIGEGPVTTLRWLLSTENLIAGGDMSVVIARSSTQEEPITPTYFNVKTLTTVGTHNTDAEMLDTGIIFADSSGTRLRELALSGSTYDMTDLNVLAPHICQAGIADFAVQRAPETRIHVVLDDGTVALFLNLKTEDLKTWVTVVTDGDIEEAFTMPGTEEDEVYYVVKRTIDGSTVRYLERWALASECVGGTANKQADSFYHYSGAAATSITGLDHLEGESVVVWADGVDVGPLTVASGTITLTTAAAEVIAGLSYNGRFKSAKLASNLESMIRRGRIARLGVILADTHAQGLEYGPDFTTMDHLPPVENNEAVDADSIWDEYNFEFFAFNGTYKSDTRLCLRATAPRPCTVMAAAALLDRG